MLKTEVSDESRDALVDADVVPPDTGDGLPAGQWRVEVLDLLEQIADNTADSGGGS